MKATIWHNPRCSKSRETLAMLESEGVELTVVEYLKDPPSAEQLQQLYFAAGMTPHQGLRAKDAQAKGLDLAHADDATVLAAMAADPSLIERPLVQTEKGVRLGRPPEKVREIM